jgi:hypothetical protein
MYGKPSALQRHGKKINKKLQEEHVDPPPSAKGEKHTQKALSVDARALFLLEATCCTVW